MPPALAAGICCALLTQFQQRLSGVLGMEPEMITSETQLGRALTDLGADSLWSWSWKGNSISTSRTTRPNAS